MEVKMKRTLLIMLLVALPFALAVTPTAAPKQYDPTCIKTALTAREDALAASWSAYSSSIFAAYQKRKTDLLNAYSLPTGQERKKATTAAWNEFKKTVRVAKAALNKSRVDTWKQFRAARTVCRKANTYGMEDLEPSVSEA